MLSVRSVFSTIAQYRWRWLAISLGFFVLYYLLLLGFTMLRFQEIPNYVEVYDVLEVYHLIWVGTPSISDMIPIMLGEPWFETGYKNPNFYGVATWSYMLIPPKMLLVLLVGMLLATFFVLKVKIKSVAACAVKQPLHNRQLAMAAGIGTGFVSLTSATLTWVVCCATPSWSVALAMLGMSGSLALWLEPIGMLLSISGIGLLLFVILYQMKYLTREAPMRSKYAN